MSRFLDHARRQIVGYVALFVAVSGTSYAAFSVPANSVGTRQIRNHAVTPIKFASGKIGAYVRAWAVIQSGTKVIAARPRARVLSWDPSFAAGVVSWGSAISSACFPLTTGSTDFVQAAILPGAHGISEVHYQLYTNTGQYDPNPVVTFIAVLCPEP